MLQSLIVILTLGRYVCSIETKHQVKCLIGPLPSSLTSLDSLGLINNKAPNMADGEFEVTISNTKD